MIKVNGRTLDWQEEMNIVDLLKVCGYTYADLIVSLNGIQVAKESFSSTKISDGDRIVIIHPIVGG